MQTHTFAWSVPQDSGWYGIDYGVPLLAAWRKLPHLPDGVINTGHWLGFREHSDATAYCIDATFVTTLTGEVNLLDFSRWNLENGDDLYLINWEGLAEKDALSIHDAVGQRSHYVGMRSVSHENTGTAKALLRDMLPFRLRLRAGVVELPCIQDGHDSYYNQPIMDSCFPDRAWQDYLEIAGIPMRVFHPEFPSGAGGAR